MKDRSEAPAWIVAETFTLSGACFAASGRGQEGRVRPALSPGLLNSRPSALSSTRSGSQLLGRIVNRAGSEETEEKPTWTGSEWGKRRKAEGLARGSPDPRYGPEPLKPSFSLQTSLFPPARNHLSRRETSRDHWALLSVAQQVSSHMESSGFPGAPSLLSGSGYHSVSATPLRLPCHLHLFSCLAQPLHSQVVCSQGSCLIS